MRWPFGKKRDDRASWPALTTTGYGLWIRAQRPPLQWFASLTQIEQEALAKVGDTYVENVAVALAMAIHDPVAASDGLDAQHGDRDAEAALVQRMADAAAVKIASAMRRQPAAAPSRPEPPPSMGGLKERQEARVRAERAARAENRSLFGQRPTGVA